MAKADISMSLISQRSTLVNSKLCKADLSRIREAIDKFSKRALAEMKFCNGTDEESDVVFDWCSQVV